MSMSKQQWHAELTSSIQACRAKLPVPTQVEISKDPLALAMYRIEGGFMQTWITEYGPRMLKERDVLMHGKLGPEPVVVIHGDMPLLVACRILLRDGALDGEGDVVAMLSSEYADFIGRNPERVEFDFHIQTWSGFELADRSLLDRARSMGHEISVSSTYYDHVNGTLWAKLGGLEVHNLWRWDGEEMSLVEEAIDHARF
jgi:hypothetical protein